MRGSGAWRAENVCALSIVALSVVQSQSAAAAEPASAPEPEPTYETTVTALRLPRPLPDAPSAITVIPRDEMDRAATYTPDELVRLAPSAATFRRTPALTSDPSAQGVNLRGVAPSAVSRALVLLDGIPANDPFGGWMYWRAIPRLGLQQIEIAPAGSSALYGNFGLGGTVQLLSSPIENRLRADVGYGTLDTRMLGAHLAGRRGVLGGALDLDALSSDGYVPVAPEQRGAIDRAASSEHAAVNGRVQLAPAGGWTFTGRLSGFVENQNGGTRYTTAKVRTGLGALSVTRTWGTNELQASVHSSAQRFRQTRARIADGRAAEELSAEQYVPSIGQGASLTWSRAGLPLAGSHTILVGADGRRVRGRANEVLFPRAGAPDDVVVARESGGEQRFLGIFAQDLYALSRRVELLAGARLDGWSNVDARRRMVRAGGGDGEASFPDRSATELSPRLGVLVRPVESTRLRATAYRAFRAPTLNELYRPFQVGTVLTAPNENLSAETLLGAELGVERLLMAASALRVTGFWNRLDGPIITVTLPAPLPDGATRQRMNVGRARIRGVEAALDLRLYRRLFVNLAYTLVDARVTTAPDQPALIGKRLPQDPVHRARVALAYVDPRWGEYAMHVRAQSRQFEDDLNTLPMGGYAVVDLTASVPLGVRLALFGSVQNLFDQRYLVGRAGVDTIGPPLLALAGLRLR